MNDEKFKRHLKDMVQGHHHPEEHDWEGTAASPKRTAVSVRKSKPVRKTARKK